MKEIEFSEKIQAEITKLLGLSKTYISSSLGAHEMEQGLLKQFLKLGYVLLLYILEMRIEG